MALGTARVLRATRFRMTIPYDFRNECGRCCSVGALEKMGMPEGWLNSEDGMVARYGGVGNTRHGYWGCFPPSTCSSHDSAQRQSAKDWTVRKWNQFSAHRWLLADDCEPCI